VHLTAVAGLVVQGMEDCTAYRLIGMVSGRLIELCGAQVADDPSYSRMLVVKLAGQLFA
jgi:hypothetical protein